MSIDIHLRSRWPFTKRWRTLFRFAVQYDPPPAEPVRVTVERTTEREALARDVADALARAHRAVDALRRDDGSAT